MHQGTVGRGMGVGAQYTAHVEAQGETSSDHRGRQKAGEQALQRRTINPAIFQCFIYAGPGALKAGGLRQLDEAAGLAVGQEGIGKVKQRIAGLGWELWGGGQGGGDR